MPSRRRPSRQLYGWSARGVTGNPIMQTYLPLLNSYGGNFVNDDWSPGFAGPEGVGALERLFSFIPYMPSGVAAFDTSQETQVHAPGPLHGHDRVHRPGPRGGRPAASKVVGQDRLRGDPGAGASSGPAIGTFICGIASGAKNPAGAVKFLEWFTSTKCSSSSRGAAARRSRVLHCVTRRCRRSTAGCRRSPTRSTRRTRSRRHPTSRRWKTSSARAERSAGRGDPQKSGYQQIAQTHLTTAANQITAYLKQQGTYYLDP